MRRRHAAPPASRCLRLLPEKRCWRGREPGDEPSNAMLKHSLRTQREVLKFLRDRIHLASSSGLGVLQRISQAVLQMRLRFGSFNGSFCYKDSLFVGELPAPKAKLNRRDGTAFLGSSWELPSMPAITETTRRRLGSKNGEERSHSRRVAVTYSDYVTKAQSLLKGSFSFGAPWGAPWTGRRRRAMRTGAMGRWAARG